MKLLVGFIAAGTAAVIAPLLLVVLIVTAAGGDGRLANAGCATDTNLAPILATIRSLESGGDYSAEAAGSTASGAYQFVDGTWDGFGGYARAVDAPPAIQDQKATEMVRSVLDANGNQVRVVPVVWYVGHLPADGSAEWDTVPVPDAGNVLTPREYQARWLEQYDIQSADALNCVGGVGTFNELPGSLDCSDTTWGGFANGHIPSSAMRYRSHSGQLHPHASATFDELFAAAQAAGLDLRGYGYRPASEGGATSGTSCHGLGLAVDIAVLVTGDGHRYRTTETAFASAEFTWLCHNAQYFGWINPRWAIPEGMVCGSVVGTGTGGHVGDDCCFLEPWHIEAAGSLPFLATPADRPRTSSGIKFTTLRPASAIVAGSSAPTIGDPPSGNFGGVSGDPSGRRMQWHVRIAVLEITTARPVRRCGAVATATSQATTSRPARMHDVAVGAGVTSTTFAPARNVEPELHRRRDGVGGVRRGNDSEPGMDRPF